MSSSNRSSSPSSDTPAAAETEPRLQDAGGPEFSRPLPLDTLPKGEARFRWTASGEECAALARRFDIPAVHALSASVHVRALSGRGILADIDFEADVEQRSVVSLDTVRVHIAERAAVRYLQPEKIAELDARAEEEGSIFADEDIEPIGGESIDIGETIAQQLSLALDPYPRQDGERLEDYWVPGDDEVVEERNPFEVLKDLK